MTARRPCRILGDLPVQQPQDENQVRRLLHATHHARSEAESAGVHHDDVDSQAFRYARDVPDDMSVLIVHPALTDYGPESAARFFRLADANHQPMSQEPPPPTRSERRPRNQKASRPGADSMLSDFSSPFQQYDTATEHPEFANPARAKSKPLPEVSNTLSGTRKLSRPTQREQLANDENQVPLRRKGTKRARRTSGWNRTHGEDNPPQAHNIPQNSALLRNMRLRRAGLVNEGNDCDDSQSDWDDKDTETASNLEAYPRLNVCDSLASADRGDRSESAKQGSLEAKKIELEVESVDDDTDGVSHDLRTNVKADVMSMDDDQSRQHRTPAAARSRAAVDRRRSQLSSSRHASRRPGRQGLRDNASALSLEQNNDENEGLDGGIASSDDDLTRNRVLNELHSNTSRRFNRNTESQNLEVVMSPLLKDQAAPTSVFGNSTSVPTVHGDHFAPRQTVLRFEESREFAQRRQIETVQCASTQALGGSKTPMVSS
jgi:hypothetical protein